MFVFSFAELLVLISAFESAFLTAEIIPFELNVAPLTASTFVVCFFTISSRSFSARFM